MIKQSFINDVYYYMDNLLNMISSVNDEKSHNDNMYVNNIIVKKMILQKIKINCSHIFLLKNGLSN